MIQLLHDHLGLVAGILGALSTIWKTPRKMLWSILRGFLVSLRAPYILMRVDERLARIEKEVQLNGGKSMKDYLLRTESYRKHDFWTRGRPAMEMDERGHVNLVSEALCLLFQVATPEDLMRRSWLRFLDGEEVDELVRAFQETAAADSMFRYQIQVMGKTHENRGVWEFQAGVIKPDTGGCKLYSGAWSPVDEVARQIADRHRWAS